MAKTMTQATRVSGVTVASGAGTTTTTGVSVSDSYETLYTIWITTDTTNGPSTAAGSVQLQISPDNSNFADWGAPVRSYMTANSTRSVCVKVPMSATYARIVYVGNVGGGDLTYTVKETQVTSI